MFLNKCNQQRINRTLDYEEMSHLEPALAKPFLKWAGGKGQLLHEIKQYYLFDNERVNKYAEPFVGGGAVLFDILNKYKLKEVYISDINTELINTYITIRDDVYALIKRLQEMQTDFFKLNEIQRRSYYLQKRNSFNEIKLTNNEVNIEKAALMIFLNRTCFNGLFRVNKKGFFNVPMGSYKNPIICDKNNLIAVSTKLQKVEISCCNYSESAVFIDENTFVYFDPPYRPLTKTSNFTAYSEEFFNDKQQIELADFIRKMCKKGARILVSNSDPKNVDQEDNFFDNIYSYNKIRRIEANRMINSNTSSRGKIKELLISNF